MAETVKQKTLAKPVECTGVGVHSGRDVRMRLKPAPANYGIRFIRTDLADNPEISARFNMVTDTTLATVLESNGAIVSTIEHLLASFTGMEADNVAVELDSHEIPIMDGSAKVFAGLIGEAGLREQDVPRVFFRVKKPVEIKDKEKFVGIYPASSFMITYDIGYDHPMLRSQTCTLEVTPETFENEIASARTFGFRHEVEYMHKNGLAKGGSLDNAIVIDEDGVMNKEGLRFKDEFVRHKILDCIGDFSLIGMPIIGHVRISKSGHAFNHAFIEKFFTQRDCWVTEVMKRGEGGDEGN